MSRQASRPLQPVDPQELYNVLAGAASQDPVLVKASADRLKQMTEMLGTYDGLSHFAAQRDIPLVVRQQSIIQLKNSALSHWRSRRSVSSSVSVSCLSNIANRRLIPDQDRVKIRARCLMFLNEASRFPVYIADVLATEGRLLWCVAVRIVDLLNGGSRKVSV